MSYNDYFEPIPPLAQVQRPQTTDVLIAENATLRTENEALRREIEKLRLQLMIYAAKTNEYAAGQQIYIPGSTASYQAAIDSRVEELERALGVTTFEVRQGAPGLMLRDFLPSPTELIDPPCASRAVSFDD